MRQVLVIGGGAAGLMAAISAARAGAKVTLLEQNKQVGKKLLATGNGRCNLANRVQDLSCYRGSSPEFVRTALDGFGLLEALEFFHGIGIVTRERNGLLRSGIRSRGCPAYGGGASEGKAGPEYEGAGNF